ncbi:MAG: hypothetical protein JW818_04600 [Pirellulales bacterium]|nr:hypothetical protein [Pirellulales bacterium]
MASFQGDKERPTRDQKESELFAISLALFIALNCASYLVRSHGGNLSGSFLDLCESIGFPFVILSGGGGFEWVFYWYALLADLAVAWLASRIIARTCSRKYPCLFLGRAASGLQYSLRSILVLMTFTAILFGVPRLGPQPHFIVRDAWCFLAPLVTGIVWMNSPRLSWLWLGVTGIVLLTLAVFVSFPPMPSPVNQIVVSKVAMRAFVIVAGILSCLVLGTVAFRFLFWAIDNERLEA